MRELHRPRSARPCPTTARLTATLTNHLRIKNRIPLRTCTIGPAVALFDALAIPNRVAEVGIALYALLMPKFVIEPARTPEMPMRRT
ncbi:hypothetical protein RHA1_ro03131 [Rhodococcus jostii RHA1]|uniref:Uncharacterized protein n=1 Tax=Rhodococcus jostii (strain RHA1) TaxID=101510 RepID=Q0SC02_RHOJR|nr:hypothetical protein RHA1_ro03131 [Rhodococcus jostii RHA1]